MRIKCLPGGRVTPVETLKVPVDQNTLTIPGMSDASAKRKATIREEFDQFDYDNPQVYSLLCSMALKKRREGYQRYSIKALYEVVRQDGGVVVKGKRRPFRLPNAFTAHYARKLMDQEPELDGFFSLRPLRSEAALAAAA